MATHVRAESEILREELENYKTQCEELAFRLQKSESSSDKLESDIKSVSRKAVLKELYRLVTSICSRRNTEHFKGAFIDGLRKTKNLL